MPKRVKPLTAVLVQHAKFEGKPRRLFDGKGLFLHIIESGKFWRMKFRHGDRESIISFGAYPEVSLAEARQACLDARALLRQGIDPVAHRRAQKTARRALQTTSFEPVAREWWESVHRRRTVASHADRNLRRLELHIFPSLGHVPINEIPPRQLLAVLKALEQSDRASTARRLRSLCGQIFRFGILLDVCERDTAADLRDALATPGKRHFPALTTPEELGALLQAIDRYAGDPAVPRALKMLALLFCRPNEVRRMKWADFDLEAGTWNYQASKGGPALLTPLPRQAIAILRQMGSLTGNGEYVFSTGRAPGRPLSVNTLTAALVRLGYGGQMSAHSFRAAARTILAERLEFPPELIEQQLGHTVRDAMGRAYNRTQFVERRGEMLQKWADYLDELRGAGPGTPSIP